jgi:hypothetical protein
VVREPGGGFRSGCSSGCFLDGRGSREPAAAFPVPSVNTGENNGTAKSNC